MPVKPCRKRGLTCSRNGRKDTIRKLLCHPFPCLATGLPHPINGLYTPDVVQTYTMRTPSVHHAYTIYTPSVHHAYTIRTPCQRRIYSSVSGYILQGVWLCPRVQVEIHVSPLRHRKDAGNLTKPGAAELGRGSARVPRAADGVPPSASPCHGSVTVCRPSHAGPSLRRDAANHTPETCAPLLLRRSCGAAHFRTGQTGSGSCK